MTQGKVLATSALYLKIPWVITETFTYVLLCVVFLLLFCKSGILNSIQCELDEGER